MVINDILTIYNHKFFYTFLSILNIIFLIIVIYKILTSRRDPVGAVVWLFIVIFIPVVGILLYFLFGWTRFHTKIKKLAKKSGHIQQLRIAHLRETDKIKAAEIIETYKKSVKSNTLLLNAFEEQHPPSYGNRIEMLISGNEAYPEMLEAIDSAEKNICLQSYIFTDDNIGYEFAERLIKKSESGIAVRVIYDPIGSIKTKKRFWKMLSKHGIKVESFGSLNFLKRKLRLNFRNHRKNLIVDGKIVFCGGLNIYDDNYSKYCQNSECFIRDYHFKIQGRGAGYFQAVFASDWFFLTGENINGLDYFPALHNETGDSIIRVIDSNPITNYKVYSLTLLGAIMHAEKNIKIITPYFYPEPEILSALKYAGLSGVEVEIILPEKNEHKIIEYASQSLYKELLECNINIYHRKLPFIHSKAMIIDDTWAILGSANFDYISMRLNFELCFEAIGKDIIDRLNKIFEYEKSQSEKVFEFDHNPLKVLRNNFCSLFAPVL
ncbi:MAG TPA: cardiolipin synthase [bacterium]|nr:cardiolipin synthase [bacterium]